MSTPTFARARSDEQRSERRDAILGTAAAMLDEMRVADLSLNELARRVGLAKSNVLRYFESREAVLLDLYDREQGEWLDALEAELGASGARPSTGDDAPAALAAERREAVARAVASTAAVRPRLCELAASASGVLEHNVSETVAAAYKTAALAHSSRLAQLVLSGLDVEAASASRPVTVADPRALVAVATISLAISGLWAGCRPSQAVLAAYAAHPDLAVFQVDFEVGVREIVATALAGLAVREPVPSA